MTTINIKTHQAEENWTFLLSFFAFALLTLALTLKQFALPFPYKIAIFYAGFMAATPSLISAWTRRRLTLGWTKVQTSALKLIALL